MVKKQLKKEEKAITLIALVISIIVLLILAGVTIAALSGENGILTQAGNTKEQMEKADIIERAKIEIVGVQSENNGELPKEDLDRILKSYDKDGTIRIDDEGNRYIVTSKNYKILASDIWSKETPETPSGETLLSQITSANYGDKVTYTANGVSDWKILYKDTTNVYIVASDYLAHGGSSDTSKIVSGTGMTKKGIYKAYWNLAPSSADTTNHVAKFSPVTAETKAWSGNYSTNDKGKCVSALLDTILWSAYASGTGGESAIGSPTLNMFVASWNEKYPSDKIYCNNGNATGYYFGTSSVPTTDRADLSGKTGYENTLYYPYTSETSDSCYGYWLATPSAVGDCLVMRVNYGRRS